MKIACPNCGAPIPARELDVATDVGICPVCDASFSLSAIVKHGGQVENFDIRQVPRGAWYEETGTGWRIGATTRSPGAFFMVPFACVWSGGALGIVFGMKFFLGQFNVWLTLLGIGALVAVRFLGRLALMTVCGKVEVTVEEGEGRIFTGFGRWGSTEHFEWGAISAVEEDLSDGEETRNRWPVLALVGQARIKFGAELNEARRYYVLKGLQKLLAEGKPMTSNQA